MDTTYLGYGIKVYDDGAARITSTPSGCTDVVMYSDFTLKGLQAKLDRLAAQGIGEEHIRRDSRSDFTEYHGDGRYTGRTAGSYWDEGW